MKKFAILCGVVLFLMFGIKPLATLLHLDKYRYSNDTRHYAEQIEAYSPEELNRLIASSDVPVMLHLYASWCPYCREQAPVINQLAKDHADYPIRVVSVDDDIYALAAYLMAKQELNFRPYRIDEKDFAGYQRLLEDYGITYAGTIPYTVFLNAEKKAVAQFRGVVDKATLEAAINEHKTDE